MPFVSICINSRTDLLWALTIFHRMELYNLHILLCHLLLVEMGNGLSQIPKELFSDAHLFGGLVISNC